MHPPTAVFHSVAAWLTKPHSKDAMPELVVSKGTVLEVYAPLYVWILVVMADLVYHRVFFFHPQPGTPIINPHPTTGR